MLDVVKYCLKASLYGIIFFQCTCFFGQKKITFGNVGLKEFNEDYKSVFPSANAIVLYRYVEDDIGNYVIVHERIKVINENGYDAANVSIPYGNVIKIEGATYNVVDGEIKRTELSRFLQGSSDRKIKIANTRKFTMPKVLAGSIFEYRYKATRGTNRDIPMQYNIPIKQLNITLSNATGYNFKFLQNPRAVLEVDIQSYSNTTVVVANDIDPLEEEPYVSDMEMYRSKIEIKNIGVMRRQSLRSFDDFVEILLDTDDFTRGYLPRNVYKDDLQNIVGEEKNPYKIAELIYDYVKENFTWNDYYGIFPDSESSRVAFHKKSGDIADINLLYVSMLRTFGIEANPILASTRWNGLPVTSSWESFNYILAGATINGEQYIFDAAHNKSNFKMIPQEVLNWKGLMIKDDKKYSWVNLTNKSISKINRIINISLKDSLAISGSVKEQISGYYAMNFEEIYKENNRQNIDNTKEVLDYDKDDYKISNFKLQKLDSINDKVFWDYDFENMDGLEMINDKIYFSPLLFLALDESPFVKEERRYPISFGFPKQVNNIITITLPEGYKVASLPTAVKINLPGEMGAFTYNLNESGNSIKLITGFMVGEGEISSDDYPEIKEFFKLRVEKETEKIVLVKS